MADVETAPGRPEIPSGGKPIITHELVAPSPENFLDATNSIIDHHIAGVRYLSQKIIDNQIDVVATEILFPTEGWTSNVFSAVTPEDIKVTLSALEQIQSTLELVRSGQIKWSEHAVMGEDSKTLKGCRVYTSEQGVRIHARSQQVEYDQHLTSAETKNAKGEIVADRFEFNGEARVNIKIPVTVVVGGARVTQEISFRLDQDGGWNMDGGSGRIDLDIGDGGIRRSPEDVAKLHQNRNRSDIELTIGTVLAAASALSFSPEDPDHAFETSIFQQDGTIVLWQKATQPISYGDRKNSNPNRVPHGHHHPVVDNVATDWVHQVLVEIGALPYTKFTPKIYQTEGAVSIMIEYSDREKTGGPGLRLLENPAFSHKLIADLEKLIGTKKPNPDNPLVIVDMGCGPGATCEEIYELLTSEEGLGLEAGSVSIHGVDISPHMVSGASERLKGKARVHQASFHSADLLGLPEADLVISRMAAHYDNPEHVLPQIHRLLAEGGKAIITMNVDPSNEDPRDTVPRTPITIHTGVTTQEWLYRLTEMENLLKNKPNLNGSVVPVNLETVKGMFFGEEQRGAWDKAINEVPDRRGNEQFTPFTERYGKTPYCMLITLERVS